MLRNPHGRVQGGPRRIRVHGGLETCASFVCYRPPAGVASPEFGARFRFTAPCWSCALLHRCVGLVCASSVIPLFLPSRLPPHRCPIISRPGPFVLHHGCCKYGVPVELIELLSTDPTKSSELDTTLHNLCTNSAQMHPRVHRSESRGSKPLAKSDHSMQSPLTLHHHEHCMIRKQARRNYSASATKCIAARNTRRNSPQRPRTSHISTRSIAALANRCEYNIGFCCTDPDPLVRDKVPDGGSDLWWGVGDWTGEQRHI